MKRYSVAYRLGVTPWERYGTTAAASIAALLDREQADRSQPPGHALDLGCGRGQFTPELARRGWDAVGVDYVPRVIDAAKRRDDSGARFVVGDVTDLESAGLGTFDFFLDIGCFQGLTPQQQGAEGRGVTTLANPRATLLLLAFRPVKLAGIIGGVTQQDVEKAFHGWELLSVEPADTAGLGWPMNKTEPQWYRLHLVT